jgi:hypothetical protein
MTVKKLQLSKLSDQQLEQLGNDVDLSGLSLVLKGAKWQILGLIEDGTIERTIEAASTVTFQVSDRGRNLIKSGKLRGEVDIKIDGLWFRLVSVSKEDDTVTLVFEDREVAVLRKYNKKKVSAWGKTTRARFAKSLVDEVKEFKIPFVCPSLTKAKTPTTDRAAKSKKDKQTDRSPGLIPACTKGHPILKIKGENPTLEQLSNCEKVLDVGVAMLKRPPFKMRRKVLVASIMTIITESSANNLPYGDLDSIGLFQQRPSQGWPGVMDITVQSKAFFQRCITIDQKWPNLPYGDLCQQVQHSAYPERYQKYRTEAENIVSEYGITGGAQESDSSVFNFNRQAVADLSAGTDYQFTRGFPAENNKWKKEDSWACLGRLAEEVDWRSFMVSGILYFIDEPALFKSAVRARISETSPGVDTINYTYDIGMKNAELEVKCRVGRWIAPPGTIVQVFDCGPIDGKWLVSTIQRGIFSSAATITLKKPRPKLPEPKQNSGDQTSDIHYTGPDPATDPAAVKSRNARGNIEYYPVPPPPFPKASQYSVADGPEGPADAHGVHKHGALDWFASGGTGVVAPSPGKIVEIKASKGTSGQVYGGVVKLEQADGIVWVFRHVNPTSSIRVGASVSAGTTLARIVRWSDSPSSSHCHIEVWRTLAGGYKLNNMMDPFIYMNLDKEHV